MPLSYDLTTFKILGQKSVKFWREFLENLKFQKGHSEINQPLKSSLDLTVLVYYTVILVLNSYSNATIYSHCKTHLWLSKAICLISRQKRGGRSH